MDDLASDAPLLTLNVHSPHAVIVLAMFNHQIDLLRQEWRDGCRALAGAPAGETYRDALSWMDARRRVTLSIIRWDCHLATDEIDVKLGAVIRELEAYASIPHERRASALSAIVAQLRQIGRDVVHDIEAVWQAEHRHNAPTVPMASAPSAPPKTLIEAMHRLSPVAFEQLVAGLLHAKGFAEVRRVGGANDRGVDILCRDSDGSLIAVQCKRYAPNDASRRVGAPVVQLLSAMALQRRAHRGILVTSATFTASARKQAHDFDIELFDGEELVTMVQAHPHLLNIVRAGK